MRSRMLVVIGAVALIGTVGCIPVAADGVTTPPSYRFVDPPPFFASGNVQPRDVSTSIALGPRGSDPAGFATPDGQFVVSLAAGAIAASSGATSVSVRITPLAPRHLRPVPNGLRANGNAYRVDMSYQPTGLSVARFAKPGTLLLEIPELGNALFVSPDATTWTPLSAHAIPPRRLSLSAAFPAPGYYLAATNLPELAAPSTPAKHNGVVVGLATAAVAVAFAVLAYVLLVRRRRRTPTA